MASSPNSDGSVSPPPAEQTSSSTAANGFSLPARPDYANLVPTTDDVFAPIPSRPNYAAEPAPGPRPSDGWLRNPAWMDGGRDPPLLFFSHEQVEATLRHYNPNHPSLQVQTCDPTPPFPPFTQPPPSYSTTVPVVSAPKNVAQQGDPVVHGRGFNAQDDNSGKHQVTATMLYTSVEKANPTARSRPTSKKIKSSKLGYIKLECTSRSEFIQEFLKLHDLANDYSPGVHSGPMFKLSWTGSRGGRAGAISIDNDQDFELACSAILIRGKVNCHLTIEFDVDDLSRFQITNKRPVAADEDEDNTELSYGTKIPRLDAYSTHEQLQGDIVLELKKKWVCECHQGEHGESGHCYVDTAGSHLGLNHRKLSLWAAAIAARDATKHEPPNTVDFDGLRDGRLTTSKARGCAGPRAPAAESSPNDAAALTMAAVMPILASLVPKNSPSNPPSTPVRRDRLSSNHTPRRDVPIS